MSRFVCSFFRILVLIAYEQNFPADHKYIALFPREDSNPEQTERMRDAMRKLIKKRVADAEEAKARAAATVLDPQDRDEMEAATAAKPKRKRHADTGSEAAVSAPSAKPAKLGKGKKADLIPDGPAGAAARRQKLRSSREIDVASDDEGDAVSFTKPAAASQFADDDFLVPAAEDEAAVPVSKPKRSKHGKSKSKTVDHSSGF
jgi:hypothetical protein